MEYVSIRLEDGQTLQFKGTPTEITKAIRTARREADTDFEIVNIDVTPEQ